ncbi:uncharacterized protein VP01_7362g1, partial [Puccinia sorghi]
MAPLPKRLLARLAFMLSPTLSIPTKARKVKFAVTFMRDDTATWSQLYLEKVFNKIPVVFYDFHNNFRSSFFDYNHRRCAK